MSGTRVTGLLLALGMLLQWGIPAYLIQRGQATLNEGTAYRFRTAPVDPVDPFRGRYVALDFEAATLQLDGPHTEYQRGDRVYAAIAVTANGDAVLGKPADAPPASGDYLEAQVLWADADALRLRLPFDRYYLDEHLAPEAERRYWDSNLAAPPDQDEDARRPAYVQVRVRNGYALIEELYIEGRPVRELLRSEP